MKTTNVSKNRRHPAGYALLAVITITGIAMLVAGATLRRTYTVAKLNERNNAYAVTVNAAEAAAEKTYAQVANDFATYGLGKVLLNWNSYSINPISSEDPYWDKFDFTDGQGHNKVNFFYLAYVNNSPGTGYTNNSAFTNYNSMTNAVLGFPVAHGPVYRIVSNARLKSGTTTLTNAVQVDLWLAMVPLSQFSIFYQGLLEFSDCATFNVYGRVHSNTNIIVGGSSPLKFYNLVTSSGKILPTSGYTWKPSNVSFLGNPDYRTNQPIMTLSVNMTNTVSLIQVPPTSEVVTSTEGKERMYNKAHVLLLVDNNTVTLKLQKSIDMQVPGADPSPIIATFTNLTTITSNLYFLTLTNRFYDQREERTNVTTQIDIGKYAQWLSTNTAVLGKFPSGSGNYPTVLFVADNRTTNANQQTAVRIMNGIAPPKNGGLGFTLATPNPLYVWGNYNQTNSALLHTTNTTSGTVPCSLMSDALTILSAAWQDSKSKDTTTYHDSNNRRAESTTVNAAIVTGIVPTVGSTESGGVHNLPRLLEDWLYPSQDQLTLNTSIICLFKSIRAVKPFRTPANYQDGNDPYYDPPKRVFSFNKQYERPDQQPPGMPCALVAVRLDWTIPPPNTITYNNDYNGH